MTTMVSVPPWPSHPALLTDRNWRQRCTQVFIELRAYLMGRTPE